MLVTLKNAENKEQWDKVIDLSPHKTIFHKWDFLKIAEKHGGGRLFPLLVLKGSEIIGALPLFYSKKALIRLVFSPPPNLAMPYLGPVFSKYEELKQNKKETFFFDMYAALEEFLPKEIKPHYFSCSLPPGIIETRPFGWSGYHVEPKYNYLIDLTKGEETIYKNFRGSLRLTIRKAEKSNVVIELGGEKELKKVHEMLSENYRVQGRKLSVTLKYLLDVNRAFSDNMNIYIAKYDDQIIGGMVDLHYCSKTYSWIGNTKNTVNKIDVNDLIQWRAIQKGCKDGYSKYEIIGANTPRLSFFKTKFNPSLEVYFNVVKYSSPLVKVPVWGYKNLIKPLRGKIMSKRGG